jgi:hypothetical protein
MEMTINLEELERNKKAALEEVMSPIRISSRDELLTSANRRLELISAEYKLSVDHLFSAAESNELPFSVASEVMNLISKVRVYKQA